MPVLVIAAYDENEVPNAMVAAWGCIADLHQIAIYLTAEHKTVKNILKKGAFTVSMADAEHIAQADYLGIVSGNKEADKVARAGLHTIKSEFVDAPLFEEFPMALECKMVSFAEESELMIGEIVNVCADEKILDAEGKIDLTRLNPVSYDPIHHAYYGLGEKVGQAFSDGKKFK